MYKYVYMKIHIEPKEMWISETELSNTPYEYNQVNDNSAAYNLLHSTFISSFIFRHKPFWTQICFHNIRLWVLNVWICLSMREHMMCAMYILW